MNFTSFNIELVRNDIEDALKSIGEKWNIEFNVGAIRYAPEKFSANIEGISDDIGSRKSLFTKNMYKAGLSEYEDIFLKKFSYNRKTFKVTECRPGNRKYPIIAETENGQKVKFTREILQTAVFS